MVDEHKLMHRLALCVERADGEMTETSIEVRRLLLAGYTGRDRSAVLEHVKELEALGVAAPKRIPSVFVVDPALVQVTDAIAAGGSETSGEVEVVLLRDEGDLLIGVGSDHTDRAREAVDVDASKALCAKPVAPVVWRHRDVAAHWDRLELRSWTTDTAERRLYQKGTLAEFLPVDALLDELARAGYADVRSTVIFGGTIPTLGGLAYGHRFEVELRDPVLGRAISCAYDVSAPRPPSDR